jgi:hypothetical protein
MTYESVRTLIYLLLFVRLFYVYVFHLLSITGLKSKPLILSFVLYGNTEGKRPLGRPVCGWADNIKIYRREVECEDVDWIRMAQYWVQWRALVNMVMNLRIP